jgi:hypothetical protein
MKIDRTPKAAKSAGKLPVAEARKAVSRAATAAVAEAIATRKPQHPVLEKFGEALGKGLGILVTEALAVAPGWNAKVKDAQGRPVRHVEGADRIGNHDIRKRHEEVVGPKIAALVEKMPAGALHDLLDGLARGASEAPGDSYRLEAKIADFFKR